MHHVFDYLKMSILCQHQTVAIKRLAVCRQSKFHFLILLGTLLDIQTTSAALLQLTSGGILTH